MTESDHEHKRRDGRCSDARLPVARGAEEDLETPSADAEGTGRVVFHASPTTIGAARARGECPPRELHFQAEESCPPDPFPAEDPEIPTDRAKSGPAIFIIGAGPWERELLRRQLCAHPSLAIATESDALTRMVGRLEDSWDRLAHDGYPEQSGYKQVAEAFGSAQRTAAEAEGKARWGVLVDDRALPVATLDRLFPTCQIIRVISSGRNARRARSTRRAANRLAAGRYYEIRSGDLEVAPVAVRRAALAFLNESDDSELSGL